MKTQRKLKLNCLWWQCLHVLFYFFAKENHHIDLLLFKKWSFNIEISPNRHLLFAWKPNPPPLSWHIYCSSHIPIVTQSYTITLLSPNSHMYECDVFHRSSNSSCPSWIRCGSHHCDRSRLSNFPSRGSSRSEWSEFICSIQWKAQTVYTIV